MLDNPINFDRVLLSRVALERVPNPFGGVNTYIREMQPTSSVLFILMRSSIVLRIDGKKVVQRDDRLGSTYVYRTLRTMARPS